jgi:hypothetical protein
VHARQPDRLYVLREELVFLETTWTTRAWVQNAVDV